jgi:hypothetical protein
MGRFQRLRLPSFNFMVGVVKIYLGVQRGGEATREYVSDS